MDLIPCKSKPPQIPANPLVEGCNRTRPKADTIRGSGGKVGRCYGERVLGLLLVLALAPGCLNNGEVLGLGGRERNEDV